MLCGLTLFPTDPVVVDRRATMIRTTEHCLPACDLLHRYMLEVTTSRSRLVCWMGLC